MKDYKTIKSEGVKIEYLDHVVKLMETEKEVKINKVFEQIKGCAFMWIRHKYFKAGGTVLQLIRTWENEKMTIQFKNTETPTIDFDYEDIESIEEKEGVMFGNKIYTIKLKENLTLELS